MTIKGLRILIGADPAAAMQAFRDVERAVKPLADKMKSIGASMTQYVSAPLAGLATGALYTAARMEQMENGLKAVMGSSQAAGRELKLLKEAAKSPGLGFEQAVKGSLALQSVGFSAGQARDALYEFGNAIAISGGSADDLAEVTRQLSQMQSLQKLTAENWNVIAERVPIAGRALQEAFGTKSIEAIRGSGISTEEFITRLVGGLKTLERAQGGLANAFENLKIGAQSALGAIGKDLNQTFDVQGLVEKVTGLLDGLVERFMRLSPQARGAVYALAGVAAAAGPLLAALGALGLALPAIAAGFTALTGPVGLTIVAVGTLAAAVFLIYDNWKDLPDFMDRLWGDVQRIIVGAVDDALWVIEKLGGALFDGPLSRGARALREELAWFSKTQLDGPGVWDMMTKGFRSTAEVIGDDLGGALDDLKKKLGGLGGGDAKEDVEANKRRVEALRASIAEMMRLGEIGKQFRDKYGEIFGMELLNRRPEAMLPKRGSSLVKSVGALGREELEAPATLLRGIGGEAPALAAGVVEAATRMSVALAEMGAVVRDEAAGAFEALAGVAGGAFADLVTGMKSIKDVAREVGRAVRGVVRDLVAAIAKAAILKGISMLVGGPAGAAPKGFLGSVLAQFGGARAAGGPVSLGRSYLVGERGPELFTPSQSGRIIPHHALGQGGALAVRLEMAPVVLSSGDIRFAIKQGEMRYGR